MAHTHAASMTQLAATQNRGGLTTSAKRPILLLDVMDTVVFDPFFTEMPKFFNMSFKELLAAKHPSAWVEFECGHISEEELLLKFFADGRSVDGAGLKSMMVDTYRYLDGMEALLVRLNAAGYELHTMSNYPHWYQLIEDKLQLSKYMQWTFVSCTGPMQGLRKPALDAYLVAADTLGVHPNELVFVDDRQANVDGAVAAGMRGVRFTGASQLEQELRALGLDDF